MLKNIPKILSPELLKILCEMGHGDELVLGDGNFPAESMGQRVVRADGLDVPSLLDAILQLFPLDDFVENPVALMRVVEGTGPKTPPIWNDFFAIIEAHSPGSGIEFVERFAYYERAKKAYCIVATGEEATYANVILKKGVVR